VFAECHHLALGKGVILPSAGDKALGKAFFAECWRQGTRQIWLEKFSFVLQNFLLPT